MTSTLARDIEQTQVEEGAVALWWLGQAGFVFKAGNGTVLYVDPYLTNCVEKAFGFKRLSLAPISADDARLDWLVSSHEHLDHLDVEAIPVITRNNPKCCFAGPACCTPDYDKCGVPAERRLLLEAGNVQDLSGVKLHAVRADHGDLSPEALSLLFDFGRVRVLFTGDTAFRPEMIRPLIDLRPDVLLPCINGRFGNLNAEEAADLTALASPRVVIPCHFWMFKEHNGDPEAFFQACSERCPDVLFRLLTPGDGLTCTAQSVNPLKTLV